MAVDHPPARPIDAVIKLGGDVLDARVGKVAPPDEVRDAFEGVTRAQMQIVTLRNSAEQEAAGRLRLARAERFRIEQSALAYAQSSDPLSGSWKGDWGPSASDRNQVAVELKWDGKALTGTVNPGPNAVPLSKATSSIVAL